MSLEKTETKHDNEFVKSTLDPTLFQIEDVANDNACFYRAFSNCLNYSSSSLSLNEIKDLKFYGNYKPIEEVYENALWGFYSERQDRLARYLQGKSYRWVAKNYSKQLEEYGMDIGTMILLTHEIDIEEYLDRYKYFAGDIVVDEYDSGRVYKSGERKGEAVIVKEELEDRWGGTPEQIALSEAYELPIIILTSQKYNSRNNKIITGKIRNNKPEKNVRLKLIQIIGKKYIGKKDPVFILWKKHNRQGHYMSLYIKNKTDIQTIIPQLI